VPQPYVAPDRDEAGYGRLHAPGSLWLLSGLVTLVAAGAVTMLLASHALAAGPLAASQPGFTVLDPLSASLLGVFLFGEHIRTGTGDLVGEALALAIIVAGASALSHSCLILGEEGEPSCLPGQYQGQARRKQLRGPGYRPAGSARHREPQDPVLPASKS
jgi:hypothetical protein